MASKLVPSDNQELAGFIRKFADALIENSRGDELLVKAGQAMLEKVESFIKLDERAAQIAADKKLVNQKKYDLRDDLSEAVVHHRIYLKYKLMRTPEEIERFSIKGGVPEDKQEFAGYMRKLADALIANAGGDKVLSAAGQAMLPKIEEFIKLDEQAMSLAADKKLANEQKYALRDEMRDDATEMIFYLKYKLGRTSTELDKYIV
ncbi:MAG: hypothetical protein PHQ23_07515 [Candidatus Wallbacteria bacterium]|nr:hypothetical protein [Candidatus Wallbacteria bacterium]